MSDLGGKKCEVCGAICVLAYNLCFKGDKGHYWICPNCDSTYIYKGEGE
jgi:hypothetical protein